MELAYFPPDFLKAVYGYKEGETSKVLTEYANVQPKPFALMCEEEGDSTGTKFVFYNCVATRPQRELQTKEDTIEPSTQTITVTMTPLPDGKVFAMTQDTTPPDVVNGWYDDVYIEGEQA